MKPVKEETHDVYEDAATKGLKALMAYLAYQGDNPMYEKKARASAPAISGFVKLRASEGERERTELVARRITGSDVERQSRKLRAG